MFFIGNKKDSFKHTIVMIYINIFFIYSIIGFIYETLVAFLFKNNLDSGFLYGPWTPVYGIGVLVILLFSRYLFKKLRFHKVVEEIIFLMIITVILTAMELIAGYLIKIIFHKDFWNYSNLAFHIGKYIALEISFIWSVFSLVLLKWIHPQIKKITTKIPKIVTILLMIFFTIDLIITFITKT